MNRNTLLVAVASIALMAASPASFAQDHGGAAGGGTHAGGGGTGGGAMQHGGTQPGGMQPSGMHGAPLGMSRAGAGQPHGQVGQAQGGHFGSAQQNGEVQRNAQHREQFGQAQRTGRVGQMNHQTSRRAETGQAPGRGFAEERGHQGRTNAGRENRTQEGQRAFDTHTNGGERATTGQGAASTRGAASLTSEQRTRIHEEFARVNDVPRIGRADFDVAVGRRVPRSVHFVPVPEAIYAIAPAWRGYDYFEVADEIVIVDPVTLEIIAVLDV